MRFCRNNPLEKSADYDLMHRSEGNVTDKIVNLELSGPSYSWPVPLQYSSQSVPSLHSIEIKLCGS